MTDYTKKFARKPLAELNAIDNFMFNELMQQEDKEKTKLFVRSIIEPIIGKKIRNLEVDSQKIIQGIDVGKHGIQMDAYVKAVVDDENGAESDSVDVTITGSTTIFDIEPNKYSDDDKKRARFYHSAIDSRIFLTKKSYNELENVVIILLTTYDPFGSDRMLYTIKNHCVEDPDMEYDDGAVTYFLYTRGKRDIPNEKIRNILRFLENSNYQNAKTAGMEDTMQMIDDIKHNSQIGVKYMHTWDYLNHMEMEAIEEGMAKGLAEGRAEGRAEGENNLFAAVKLLKSGAIASDLVAEGLDENTVKKAQELIDTILVV